MAQHTMARQGYRTTTHEGRLLLVTSVDMSGHENIVWAAPIVGIDYDRPTQKIYKIIYGDPIRLINAPLSQGLTLDAAIAAFMAETQRKGVGFTRRRVRR